MPVTVIIFFEVINQSILVLSVGYIVIYLVVFLFFFKQPINLWITWNPLQFENHCSKETGQPKTLV